MTSSLMHLQPETPTQTHLYPTHLHLTPHHDPQDIQVMENLWAQPDFPNYAPHCNLIFHYKILAQGTPLHCK